MSPTTPADEQTPLMKQYWELKSQAPDALLLFRMGDFYELFGPDAVDAAALLEITLTSRDRNKPNPMPMAGVPHHSVQGYIQKLLKAGRKVAIGEQLEDPDTVKGPKIVRRGIVRILTPGVQFDAEGAEANYLATVVPTRNHLKWVLTCLDASTGEALSSQALPIAEIGSECQRLSIRHFLNMTPELDLEELQLRNSVLIENLPANYIALERAVTLLQGHYEIRNLQPFLDTDEAILGLGALVTYVLRTQQQERLNHLRLPEPLQRPKSLVLGPSTAQHLDLADLFQLINQTRSSLGARQLKRWLGAPLRAVPEIRERQSAVRELCGREYSRENSVIPENSENSGVNARKISEAMALVYDLERISGRVNTNLANPKDTLALGQSLLVLERLKSSLSGAKTPILRKAHETAESLWTELRPLAERITQHQREDAPITARDGGIFKAGTTPDLDRLLSMTQDGQKWLVELEIRERERTGIPSLKVRYNRVFGYYIEITLAHLKSVPAHYQRKQTMVGAERFFTDELKKFEEEILSASTKQKSLEQELFNFLIEEIKQQTRSIMTAAALMGEMDALASVAALAENSSWNFPEIDQSRELSIEAGRHPMVDLALGGGFVPNCLNLSESTRLTLLITGPNMGGKSTIMRQTALIVLLGQMGAPVPAARAQWGVFSSLYTRIGAHDAIARGQSTFMVEMSELAHILHHADDRSLIILDEIGRGTSTYDGISVAGATLEWICKKIKARTLFATHYHELIRLSASLPLLANAHMAVDNSSTSGKSSTLRFLYELREGPTNESFGIQVAQLAGLPKAVIERAWSVLEDLEENSGAKALRESGGNRQLSFFDLAGHRAQSREVPPKTEVSGLRVELEPAPPHPAVLELGKINLNEINPIQALNYLAKLKDLCS